MHRAFATDDQGLLNEERNAERARLQLMIAEFDPEETGDWANALLTLEDCREVCAERNIAVAVDALVVIVQRLQEHCISLDPPALHTRVQLLNMTSVEEVESVFGVELVGDVMRLQDAVIDQVTNVLLTSDNKSPTDGHLPPVAFLLRPASWFSWLRSQHIDSTVEVVGTGVVVANTMFLGISADATNSGWAGWDYISMGFAVAFMADLLLRMFLCGSLRTFFFGRNRVWHIFDTVLVLLTLLDVMALTIQMDGEVNTRMVSTLRLLRLLRLTRMARLARSSFFNELSYMIRGIEAGTSTLFWAFVLLLFVAYVGGVMCTMIIGVDRENEHFAPVADMHFGSVGRSMFTLFRCFTGDCTTFEGLPLCYVLMAQYGNITVVIYWLTVMAVTFGLFNVMIANFVQNSQRAARFNDVERRRILKRERKMVHQKTQELLNAITDYLQSKRKEGTQVTLTGLQISRELWGSLTEQEAICHWLDDMGCDDGLRKKLFDKIDTDGNGMLTCPELVHGVVDLLRGRFDNFEALLPLMQSVNNRLLKLEGALALNRTWASET